MFFVLHLLCLFGFLRKIFCVRLFVYIRTPTRCKRLVKRYGLRQNLCFTLTGSFSCVWYYWSPDSSFQSQNCLWHPLYHLQWFRSYLLDRNQCVVVNNSASSSSPLMFGTCAICFVHYSTFRHCSKSPSQPSAFCRRHPTLKINSTKWCAKPAIMYRWYKTKSIDVQQPTQTKWGLKIEAILFWTPSVFSCHCPPSSVHMKLCFQTESGT